MLTCRSEMEGKAEEGTHREPPQGTLDLLILPYAGARTRSTAGAFRSVCNRCRAMCCRFNRDRSIRRYTAWSAEDGSRPDWGTLRQPARQIL